MSESRLFLVAVKQEWSRVLTGSITVALIGLLYGTGKIPIPPFVFWLLIIASLLWAFFRAWRAEHRRAEKFSELLIKEYQSLVRTLRGQLPTNLVDPHGEEQDEEYYLRKIVGDQELIREAIRRCREGQKVIPKK